MMAKPDPSAESSDGSPAQPETPEQTGHAAGTGSSPAEPGHSKLDEKLAELPIPLHSPVVLEQQMRRAQDVQLRIADGITGFAGSMNFVYLHIALFTVWMLFIESKPWPMLTLIVSLKASSHDPAMCLPVPGRHGSGRRLAGSLIPDRTPWPAIGSSSKRGMTCRWGWSPP